MCMNIPIVSMQKEHQNTVRPEQRIINVVFFNNDREEVGSVIISV